MSINPPQKEKASIVAPLTTFRFFAALAIVVFHILQSDVYSYLASGVSLFFVLSGFVLTYVHPRLDAGRGYVRFWIARFGRIWPVHVAILCVVLVFQPFGAMPYKHFFPEFFLNLFLLQSWIPVRRVAMSFNFVSWSLSIEIFFYLVFPLILPLVFKAPWKMIAASVVAYLIFAVGGVALHFAEGNSVNTVTYESFLFFPVLHLYEFVTGMAVAVWWTRAQKLSLDTTQWSLIEIAVFGGALLIIPYVGVITDFLLGGVSRYSLNAQLAGFLLVPIFALLIYVFSFQAGILSRVSLIDGWFIWARSAFPPTCFTASFWFSSKKFLHPSHRP